MIKQCEYIYAQPMGNHSSLYIDTGIIPTKDTVFRFKCIGAGYETGNITVGNYNNDSKDYRLFFYLSNGSTLMFDYNSERIQNDNWGGVPNGQQVDITVGNYYVYDNIKGENICTGNTQSQDPMDGLPIKVCVGQVYTKSIEIWQGQTKVFDGKAAYDDSTNNIGLFDSVSNTLVYNQNLSMGKGADVHILSVTPSILKFEASGGTLSFTVTAETGWTCTAPSAFTLSTTAGTSGDTVVTVTAANYTGATRIDEYITITDDDGYTASVHLRQKPVNTGVQSSIYLGETNIEVLMLGDKAVESIYLGDVQVYAQGAFQGIKMTKTASLNKDSGSTTTINVKSSEAWTLSIDTAVTWLSASVMTGDTGETVVTLSAIEDNTASTRSTVISATSANFSATCVVTQYYAHYVGYICTNPLSGRTNQYIDTGIYPTTATTMRIKFQGKGLGAYGKILGFSYSSEEPVWKDATDNTDYRFSNYDINYRRILFDYNNQRIDLSNQPYFDNGYDSDLTFGNYYIYDNDLGVNIGTGTTQTTQATTTIPIMVNVSTIYLKSLEIWQGETKVFDGKAAIDDATGHIGLFDSVSDSMKWNPNLTMQAITN